MMNSKAIKEAMRAPENRFVFKRRRLFATFKNIGLFSNWNEWAFNFGKPRKKFHRGEVPEARVIVNVKLWPFRVITFHEQKRLFWIGDRQWKNQLRLRD